MLTLVSPEKPTLIISATRRQSRQKIFAENERRIRKRLT